MGAQGCHTIVAAVVGVPNLLPEHAEAVEVVEGTVNHALQVVHVLTVVKRVTLLVNALYRDQ